MEHIKQTCQLFLDLTKREGKFEPFFEGQMVHFSQGYVFIGEEFQFGRLSDETTKETSANRILYIRDHHLDKLLAEVHIDLRNGRYRVIKHTWFRRMHRLKVTAHYTEPMVEGVSPLSKDSWRVATPEAMRQLIRRMGEGDWSSKQDWKQYIPGGDRAQREDLSDVYPLMVTCHGERYQRRSNYVIAERNTVRIPNWDTERFWPNGAMQ